MAGQETETRMGQAGHVPRQLLHPSGHLAGWGTSLPAEENLDGQCQREDIRAHSDSDSDSSS